MSKWISVDIEKPKSNKCIDIWIDLPDAEGRVCNCFYNPKNNKYWKWDEKVKNKIQFYSSDISHWMPLPEPPKKPEAEFNTKQEG
ncbi:MAG: DUF551 domain-containing protein [Pseudomonadota bacterium]